MILQVLPTNNYPGQCHHGASKTAPLFGRALPQDLQHSQLEGSTILQEHVDDLLICSPTQAKAQEKAIQALNFLAEHGYKASQYKAQLEQGKVSDLGI